MLGRGCFRYSYHEYENRQDYLRGEDSHVGQEKELQFEMQLTGGTLSAILEMEGEREDFLLMEEATLENRNINFILSSLQKKKKKGGVLFKAELHKK